MSARSTAAIASSVTWVANGLTIRTARFIAASMPRQAGAKHDVGKGLRSGSRVAAHAVEQKGVEAVGKLIRIGLRAKPGVGPVRRRQGEQRGGGVVEIRPQPAELAPLSEERAEAVLV